LRAHSDQRSPRFHLLHRPERQAFEDSFVPLPGLSNFITGVAKQFGEMRGVGWSDVAHLIAMVRSLDLLYKAGSSALLRSFQRQRPDVIFKIPLRTQKVEGLSGNINKPKLLASAVSALRTDRRERVAEVPAS
jgi:hypothetical protein